MYKANENKYKAYKSICVSLIWAGNGSLPQASYYSSYLERKSPPLRVRDLTEANIILKALKDLVPTIIFNSSKKDLKGM